MGEQTRTHTIRSDHGCTKLGQRRDNSRLQQPQPSKCQIRVFRITVLSALMASATSRATRGRRLTGPGLRAGPLLACSFTLLMLPTITSATEGKESGGYLGVRVGSAKHRQYPDSLLPIVPRNLLLSDMKLQLNQVKFFTPPPPPPCTALYWPASHHRQQHRDGSCIVVLGRVECHSHLRYGNPPPQQRSHRHNLTHGPRPNKS